MDDHDEKKKTEQNLFVRSGNSEAIVAHNRRLRSTYCSILKLLTDTHETWRGLAATAGLLVVVYDYIPKLYRFPHIAIGRKSRNL